MIKNVIFDLGNVLVDFCWRDHIAGCGYTGETLERLGRAMMQSPEWDELDRGVWSNEKLLQTFISHDPALEEQIRHVFSDLSTIIRKRPESDAWIRSLKARGLKVYYLSNYSERIRRETAKELTFLEEMDGGIMSYTVQLIKPDPAIYRLLLERYGLKPEESVFLDDISANVRAAEALGIYGIRVASQAQAAEELEQLLSAPERQEGLDR